jgi:hypothetical protein
VFDIGAGDGLMRKWVEALGLEWNGFDLMPHSHSVDHWNLDDPMYAPDARPSVVLLLDVLEHLGNPAVGLRHIAELMDVGGTLILTAPNPRWSKSRLHALLTGYPACFTRGGDLDGNGHVFTMWPHIVQAMLREAGFTVTDYVTLDGRTRWPEFCRWIRAPHVLAIRAICMLIERFDPTASGMSYAFVATRSR